MNEPQPDLDRADPDERPDPTLDAKGIRGALTRYRIMAYVVGTLLVLLVCVAMPLKYAGPQNPAFVTWIGVPHGWLFMVLLVTVYDLGRRVRWTWTRMLLIALSGLVPFMTFVAEYYAHRDAERYLQSLTTNQLIEK